MSNIPFEVIDCHIHPNFANRFGVVESEDIFIDDLKRAGVSRTCGSVIKRPEFESSWEDVSLCNQKAWEFYERYPDFYIPGLMVHGSFVEESCREVENFHAKGVRWVGELVNYCMKTGRYASRGMMQIFELCRDLGMTINLHNDGFISEIEPVLKAFPTLNIVVAHPHEFDNAKQRFEYISQFPNAYMDISGNGLQRYGMLKWAVDKCGAEKILFGSDYPINNIAMHIAGVMYERISDKEREAIFSGNFRRLTGMN
ncbi:MAG: amidohydrolase family protein [Lentisphaeria bacterium]|nr:amidohydrolase family protein [Lentisphaeria bacterium]